MTTVEIARLMSALEGIDRGIICIALAAWFYCLVRIWK